MLLGSGTELHGIRAGRPRYLRVLTAGDVLLCTGGDLGTPGNGEMRRCGTPAAAAAAAEVLVRRARKAGLNWVSTQPIAVGGTTAGELEAAFTAAWVQSWAARVADLTERASAPGPWQVLIARHWAAQTTAQPWGAALTDAVDAAVWAHDPDSDVALLRAGTTLAAWLRAYYGGPALPPAAELTAGRDTDTGDIYRMALGLWQPALPGPLARLRKALDTARTMLG